MILTGCYLNIFFNLDVSTEMQLKIRDLRSCLYPFSDAVGRFCIHFNSFFVLFVLSITDPRVPLSAPIGLIIHPLISVVGLFFARIHIAGKWSLHKFGNHEVENREPQYET